jgi:hypothetical protein
MAFRDYWRTRAVVGNQSSAGMSMRPGSRNGLADLEFLAQRFHGRMKNVDLDTRASRS